MSALAGIACIAALTGCGSPDPGTGAPPPASRSTQTASGETPKPVASLALSNGNTVAFYDFGTAALVMESGKAYTTPALKHSKTPLRPEQLSAIWRSLAPTRSVPSSLQRLQERLTESSPDSNSTPSQHVLAETIGSSMSGGDQLGPGGTQVDSPVGCDNGCCDYHWLSEFSQCQGGGDYSWFLYNYGWSYANSTDDIFYDGLVCSAVGTSTWTVSTSGGDGGVWSITQAHYRYYEWVAGTDFWGDWVPQNINTTVNDSAHTHLHTYCGSFGYD